jgi:dTDP-glucose 4,6-dehydratase
MNTLRNVPVLVTGAGGFIGSHLVQRLLAEGAQVRTFMRYNSRNDRGALEWLPAEQRSQIEYTVGDLKDGEAVRQAVKGCQVVFHLGALIAIPYSYVNPLDFVQTNVLGTAHVLNACRDYGVARLIHTSTSEVYGTARYAPIDEEHPLQGQSPYSASKIGADKLVEAFGRSFDLPVVTIRPFNTYGPRQSARAVIPTTIVQALTRDAVHLGSLEPTRDLNYVADTCDGFLRAALAGPEVLGETINLGQGWEISIGELAQRIIDLVGRGQPVVTDPTRVRPAGSEVLRLIADNRKAARLLGWRPTTSLDDGLRAAIDYVAAHLERYKADIYNV